MDFYYVHISNVYWNTKTPSLVHGSWQYVSWKFCWILMISQRRGPHDGPFLIDFLASMDLQSKSCIFLCERGSLFVFKVVTSSRTESTQCIIHEKNFKSKLAIITLENIWSINYKKWISHSHLSNANFRVSRYKMRIIAQTLTLVRSNLQWVTKSIACAVRPG